MSTATASTGTTGSGRKPVKMHTIKTLAGSIREYTKASLLSPLFVVVEAIIEILIPTVIATLIDKGITNRSMQAIWQYGLILILCAAVSLAAGFLSGRFAAIASSGFGKNLRHDEFERVQQFSFTNIDRFSTGSIIHKAHHGRHERAEFIPDDHSHRHACADHARRRVDFLVPHLTADLHGLPGDAYRCWQWA